MDLNKSRMIKRIIIPVAAFAVTANAANAMSPNMLRGLDLSDTEIEALTEASEFHREGRIDKARATLEEAGITEDVLKEIHKVGRESHFAIDRAIENNDYQAFKSLVTEGPLFEVVKNQDDFNLLTEAHKLRKSGDFEGAEVIFDDLGLSQGDDLGRGHRPGPNGINRTALDEAIDNGDFQTFLALSEGTPFADKVKTETAFLELQKGRSFMRSGDYQAARNVMQELGFKAPGQHSQQLIETS